jgi:WbqC-like protein family
VDRAWARSHWSAIEQAYGRAPCFAASAEVLAPAYHEASTLHWLSEVNHLLLRRVCEMLGIETMISWSRDYEYEQTDPSERLLAICLGAGASQYVSGPAARDYLDVGIFERAGVSVSWFDYSGYPEYRQPHGAFIHHVSVVDLLCCAGISSRGLLKSTGAN